MCVVCMYGLMCVCMYVYLCVCICVCVCVCVCVYEYEIVCVPGGICIGPGVVVLEGLDKGFLCG